jgi:uncharacterized protein YqkB
MEIYIDQLAQDKIAQRRLLQQKIILDFFGGHGASCECGCDNGFDFRLRLANAIESKYNTILLSPLGPVYLTEQTLPFLGRKPQLLVDATTQQLQLKNENGPLHDNVPIVLW